MKSLLLIVLGFSLGLALPASAELADGVETSAEPAMGVTIHGSDEAAVGLYLMPWGEEPMSDLDRPPQLIDEGPQTVNAEEFQRYAEWYQAHRSYRYWRLQRNNW
ncbi:MAG: hypothetical protein P1U47_02560 [Zhongshania sp.]|uniref:hypothetical protein n=1 Tax=Zhongshania sp. TaxID=1971902 RepID=UPI00260EE536|nr:hypothetical protein [Zhongshania sp.]MDF1691228.1 hypothetical protein [Zhongshania sp.]